MTITPIMFTLLFTYMFGGALAGADNTFTVVDGPLNPSQPAGKLMQTQAVFPGSCLKTNADATQL